MIILDIEDTLLLPEPNGITVTKLDPENYEVTCARIARPFDVWGFIDDGDPTASLYVAFCDCVKGRRDQICRHGIGVLKHMAANGGATWNAINASPSPKPAPAPARPSYFTRRETAEILGLTKKEVENLAKDGKLTPLSVGGRKGEFVVFEFAEVEKQIIPNLRRGCRIRP
jgi:hypothetical protein